MGHSERKGSLARRGRDKVTKTVLVLLAAAMVVSGLGCGRDSKPKNPAKAPRIGFSLDSLVVERWKRDIDVFGKSVRELGAEFILEIAAGLAERKAS